MADDPNRDILPVKECGPSKGPCRKMSNNITDDHHNEKLQVYYSDKPRTPNTLNKQELDEPQEQDLKNRYQAVCNETAQLRQLCGEQANKIERLASKLVSIVNERNRAAQTVSKYHDRSGQKDENLHSRIIRLERHNHSLQDQIVVLKTQLGTHSRLHNSVHCSRQASKSPSSHRSRSSTKRGPCSGAGSDHQDEDNDSSMLPQSEGELQDHVHMLVQDLETLREQAMARIRELESELDANRANEQRLHTAENIELIRLKRDIRHQSAQNQALAAQSEAVEIGAVATQKALDEVLAQNNLLQKELQEERDANASLRQDLAGVDQVEKIVTGLHGQIRDLMRENATLQKYKDTMVKLMSSGQLQTSGSPAHSAVEVRLMSSGQLQTAGSPAHSAVEVKLMSSGQLQTAGSPARSAVEVISTDQSEETPESGSRAVKFVSPKRSEEQIGDVEEVPDVVNVALPPERFPTLQQSMNVLKPPTIKITEILPMPDDNSTENKLHVANLEAELEKCKELLRVQLQLNKGTKMEADTLAKRLRDLEAETSALKQGQTVEQYDQKPSWMSLETNEGLFEIHMVALQLTADGRDAIPENQRVFVSWSFFEQSLAQTMPKPSNLAEFKSSVVYKVNVDNELLEYISKENCEMDLHLTNPGGSTIVALGYLGFSELLQFPQNKLQATVPLRCVDPFDPTKELTLGHLQCWYRLGCDVKLINEFLPRELIKKKPESGPLSIQESETLAPSETLDVPEVTDLKPSSESDDGNNILPADESSKECDGTTLLQMSDHNYPLTALVDSLTEVEKETPRTTDWDQVDRDSTERKAEVPSAPVVDSLTEEEEEEEETAFIIDWGQVDKGSTESKAEVPSATVVDSLTEIEKKHPSDSDQVHTDSKESKIPDIPESGSKRTSDNSDMGEDNPSRLSIGELPEPQIYDSPVITKQTWLKADDDGHGRVRHGSKPDIYRLIESNVSLPSAQETRQIYRTDSEREMEKDIELGRTLLESTDSQISNRTELQMMELMDANDWDRYARKSSLKKTSPSKKSLIDPPLSAKNIIPSNLSTDQHSKLLNTASSDDLVKGVDTLTVKIDYLTVDYDSDFIQNSKIAQIYVEYKFLGQSGSKLETRSLPLVSGEPLAFGYKHRFKYDKPTEQSVLMSMLNSESWHQEIVQFIVVSEPQPEEGKIKDCEEIGYADLNMKTQLEMKEDVVNRDLSVYSGDGFKEWIGTLNVSISGIAKCMASLKVPPKM